jgi:hypothetical protein
MSKSEKKVDVQVVRDLVLIVSQAPLLLLGLKVTNFVGVVEGREKSRRG